MRDEVLIHVNTEGPLTHYVIQVRQKAANFVCLSLKSLFRTGRKQIIVHLGLRKGDRGLLLSKETVLTCVGGWWLYHTVNHTELWT